MPQTRTLQGATIAGYFGDKVDPAPNSTYTLTGESAGPDGPVLLSINPESAVIGTPDDFEVYCNGAGFTPESVIVWNGGDEPTDFVSANQIHTTVNTATMLNPATITIEVRNADGKVSDTHYFEVLSAPLKAKEKQ